MSKPSSKPAAPSRAPAQVPIEALARFRHDGRDIAPGTLMKVEAIDAEELEALRFARKVER